MTQRIEPMISDIVMVPVKQPENKNAPARALPQEQDIRHPDHIGKNIDIHA